MNEIERTWNEEVREKKRTGSGVRGRKGKRGYVRGGVKTPVDLLSGKERLEYMGTSPVQVTRTSHAVLLTSDGAKLLKEAKAAVSAYERFSARRRPSRRRRPEA